MFDEVNFEVQIILKNCLHDVFWKLQKMILEKGLVQGRRKLKIFGEGPLLLGPSKLWGGQFQLLY